MQIQLPKFITLFIVSLLLAVSSMPIPVVYAQSEPVINGASPDYGRISETISLTVTGANLSGLVSAQIALTDSGGAVTNSAVTQLVEDSDASARIEFRLDPSLAAGAYMLTVSLNTAAGSTVFVLPEFRAYPQVFSVSPSPVAAGSATQLTFTGVGFDGVESVFRLNLGLPGAQSDISVNSWVADSNSQLRVQTNIPADAFAGPNILGIGLRGTGYETIRDTSIDVGAPPTAIPALQLAPTINRVGWTDKEAGEQVTVWLTGDNFVGTSPRVTLRSSGGVTTEPLIDQFVEESITNARVSFGLGTDFPIGNYDLTVVLTNASGSGDYTFSYEVLPPLATATLLPTSTPTVLPTSTPIILPTATATNTPSVTPEITQTATITPALALALDDVLTSTVTPTQTPTPTFTPTPSSSSSPSPTADVTVSATVAITATESVTPTATPTVTNTPTETSTPSPTATGTLLATATALPAVTFTATPDLVLYRVFPLIWSRTLSWKLV